MKRFLLTPYASTLVGGALLAGSSVAIAQAMAPNLTVPEKATFSCIEQALSIAAAVVERAGCATVANPGIYSLGGNVNFDGDGSCTVDDFTINVDTVLDDFRGTHVATDEDARGEFDDVEVDALDGDFWFSRSGEIMYADAAFTLCLSDCGPNNPQKDEPHDEHIIKDFFKVDNGEKNGLIQDAGLEVITKMDYPRMKFRQDSEYTPPNGGLGELEINKVSIAPENAPVCGLRYEAEVDDFGGGIQFTGTLFVLQM